MRSSEETNEVLKALVEVKMSVGVVDKTGENAHIKSKYRKIENLMNALLPVLSKNGCVTCFLPEVETYEGKSHLSKCTLRLTHLSSGQWIEMDCSIRNDAVGKGMQGEGACLTYAKRYLMTYMFDVESELEGEGDGELTLSDEEVKNQKSQNSRNSKSSAGGKSGKSGNGSADSNSVDDRTSYDESDIPDFNSIRSKEEAKKTVKWATPRYRLFSKDSQPKLVSLINELQSKFGLEKVNGGNK